MKSEPINVDWSVNSGRRRLQVVLLLFRFAQITSIYPRPIRRLVSGFYRAVALNFFAIDIPSHTQVGPRLRIHHGFGLVINAAATIGADVELRHSTTIGSRFGSTDCPQIGDGVSIGPQTTIIGDIVIGHGAKVGAGSVVLHDVPAGATVAGSPARVLR